MTDILDRPSLYDRDFYQWTREQARLLREAAAARMNTPFDLENLAEEIESLGKRDQRTVARSLARIIEHCLKLELSPAEDPRRGWEISVQHQRMRLERLLKQSPSLRGGLDELLPDSFLEGRLLALKGMVSEIDEGELPVTNRYRLEDLLDPDWFPERLQREPPRRDS